MSTFQWLLLNITYAILKIILRNLNYVQCLNMVPMAKAWFTAPMEYSTKNIWELALKYCSPQPTISTSLYHCVTLQITKTISRWIRTFLKQCKSDSVTQKNPFLTVVIGDFNTRSSKWWSDDKTNQEGLKTKNLASQFALSQVIIKPTHISRNFNSCIDLLFSNQQNLITESVVHPSLHSNCHHQIIYGMFNLKIFYALPYKRHIWYYEHANAGMISKVTEGFYWDKKHSQKRMLMKELSFS